MLKGELNMAVSFIYGVDRNLDIFKFSESVESDFRKFESYERSFMNKHECELYIEGKIDQDEYLLFTEQQESFLSKVGSKVLKLFDDIVKLIDNLISKFTGIFKKQPSENEMKKVFDKHPEYADAFLNGLKTGNVKYCDYQDLSEIIDAAEKASNDLKSGKLSKKSFIDKMNDLITSVDSKLQPSAGLLKTLGGATQSLTNIIGFKNACEKEMLVGQKQKRILNLMKADLVKDMTEEASDDETRSCLSWKIRLYNKILNETGRTSTFFDKATDKFANLVDKVAKDDKKISAKDFAAGPGNFHKPTNVAKLKEINTYDKMSNTK